MIQLNEKPEITLGVYSEGKCLIKEANNEEKNKFNENLEMSILNKEG